MDDVPGSDGAVQLAVICPLAPVPVTPVGAPGKADQVRAMPPGQPVNPVPVAPLVLESLDPPLPVDPPAVPCATDRPQTVDVPLPATKLGFVPLTKLVTSAVATHEEPAPPPPLPSDGVMKQKLPAPPPPPA